MRVSAFLLAVFLSALSASAQEDDPFEPSVHFLKSTATSQPSEGGRPLLGLQAEDRDGQVIVFRLVKDSPAALAGVRLREGIVAVNGIHVQSADHFRQMVNGPELKTYDIVFRDLDGGQRTLAITKKRLASVEPSQFALGYPDVKSPVLKIYRDDGKLRIVPSGDGTLSGRISDGNAPVVGAEVAVLVGRNDFRTGYGVTNSAGRYEISVPTGPLELFGFIVHPWPAYTNHVIANSHDEWRGRKVIANPGVKAELPTIVAAKPVVLIEPRKFDRITGDNVRFSWAAYPSARKYRLQILPYPMPGEQPEDLMAKLEVTGTEYCCYSRPPNLDAARTRFVWRVIAIGKRGGPAAISVPAQGEFILGEK